MFFFEPVIDVYAMSTTALTQTQGDMTLEFCIRYQCLGGDNIDVFKNIKYRTLWLLAQWVLFRYQETDVTS